MSTKQPAGTKRGRGRPPVPSKYDADLMTRLADRMVGRRPKYLSEAIRAALPPETPATDSLIRRVRRHWRDNKATLLPAAEKRSREQARAHLARVAAQAEAAASSLSKAMRAIVGDHLPLTDFSAAAEVARVALYGGANVAAIEAEVQRAIGPAQLGLGQFDGGVAEQIARQMRDALAPLHLEQLRATDALYVSPRRPRYATDFIQDEVMRLAREMEGLMRRGLM